VLGGEVEDDAVRRIAQELFARLLGREHAAFALDAQSALDAAVACNQANHRFGEVDVEVVADDVPARVGAALLSRLPKNRAKSFSLRVFPITPSTSPVVTSKAAISA
jgi:hypothetical protein